MYLSYFGLTEAPFSIAPDPRYLYMTRGHQEALAHLLYGVNGDGGFVLLTGEVGAGKTTVCRCLIEQIPDSCDVAYVFNPKLTVEELLSVVCLELGIASPPGNTSIGVFVDCINAYLLDANAKGRHTVLIIDEAQNLSAEVLEQMRLLTNLETNQRKLLQIILLGQPELAEMLDRPGLRQLAQRIVARYHLGALAKSEVAAYVQHRLDVSGNQRQIFPKALMGQLYRLSKGVPRIINVLCDRALLGTYTQGKERVDHATLAQAAREVFGQRTVHRRTLWRTAVAALLIATSGALALGAYRWTQHDSKTAAVTPATVRAAATPAAKLDAAGSTPTAPVAEKPAQVLAWPQSVPRTNSRSMAYAALFQTWKMDYEGGDACQQATRAGLHCRVARGGLGELREMNLPAVMHMKDEQGQEFYVTLTRLNGNTATLAVGGKSRTIALEALADQWSGHYTVMWRMPPQVQEHIRFGERGAAVAWLSQMLPKGQGSAAQTSGEPVFDDAMTRRIRQFQLAQGLIPDGVIGPQTLIRLSALSDQAAPQLTPGQGKK
ncbi:putative General secretion pathway protein A [Georgfuchsia toluolica]|uniref:General secretion pathway protein A n=1 Tax=Georgfuchsia toluolica TaxID=424218 RepID=A0A916N972_9PROT|nr:AAA family ATPase [Georgfuchsia toluolica]CAG4883525.1 putative General secretion pathway protein A [Georgfuchsia toluolica]